SKQAWTSCFLSAFGHVTVKEIDQSAIFQDRLEGLLIIESVGNNRSTKLKSLENSLLTTPVKNSSIKGASSSWRFPFAFFRRYVMTSVSSTR
ncbi:TPA: hypothetical protein ACKCJ3_000454, partial [Streptococcus pneumoniae]